MTDLQKIIERMEYINNDLSVGLLKLKLRVDELESQVSIYRQQEKLVGNFNKEVTVVCPDYSDVVKPYKDKIKKAREILDVVLNDLRIMGYPSGLSNGFFDIRDVLANDIMIQGSAMKDLLKDGHG